MLDEPTIVFFESALLIESGFYVGYWIMISAGSWDHAKAALVAKPNDHASSDGKQR